MGHILRGNCFLKRVIEENIDMTGRRGRRRKQPMDYRKETRRYWKLKEEERGSTRSHCLGSWLLRRLWTCRETRNGVMNQFRYFIRP